MNSDEGYGWGEVEWDAIGNQVTAVLRALMRGFPGGAVVKNPPASAGDMGSSPGPGRSHMPWSN